MNEKAHVAVVSIVKSGVIVQVHAERYLLEFDMHKWFVDAPARKIFNIELHGPAHLYWPDLDIDLDLDVIRREDEQLPGAY